ncbi:MAG: Gfo/Idh/MocA family oxidoreductase [Planctomycetia bacterium]|nr:Gfo/Idh/MocA family oxidoreductase [Planctomycetia bacterium]
MNRGSISRRGFLENSMGAMIAAGLPLWYARGVLAADQEKEAASQKRIGPNDTITMGAIGVGGQGTHIMKRAMKQNGVKYVAVCDVDSERCAKAAKVVGDDCKEYKDFRELVDHKGLDAVTVGTVDHWHALTSIAAMKAGLDVYCEKPLALTVEEGRAMVKATRKYDRIFQTGNMQRSDKRYRFACELVRNGRFGKIHTVEARIGDNPVGGPFPEVEVPKELDWDFWQGPTGDVPYVKERCHYEFRWWYEYSGGKMTDWGAHHNDIAQWGLGADDTGPVYVTATGVQPSKKKNSYNCHPHFAVTSTYADGTALVTTSDGENGNRFIGDRGWVFVSRGRIEASEPKLLDEPLGEGATLLYESNDHMRNFIEGVRTRKRPICDVEVGHRSAAVCHIGAISLRLGLPLQWDPSAERFVGPHSDEGNKMLSREMRSPWKLEV